MATKIVKIEESEAKALYKIASKEFKAMLETTFGKSFFSEKVQDRVNNFEDILEIAGIDDYQSPYKNPKTRRQKSINALDKLFIIVEVYNEGEELDWKDTNQYKWFPYKYFSGGSGCSLVAHLWTCYLSCPAGVHLKNKELCEDVIKKFKDIVEDFLMNKE